MGAPNLFLAPGAIGVRRNFSRRDQSRHFAYIFQVTNADDQVRNQQQENISWSRSYDDAMQMDVNKKLCAFY